MKSIKISLFFIVLILNTTNAMSQKMMVFYFIPSVNIGYGINGKGITYGFDLDIVKKIDVKKDYVFTGITVSKYWSKVKFGRKYDTHRITTVTLMATDFKYYDVKLGGGIVRNPWGYGNRNRCITLGDAIDISFFTNNPSMPWIGYKSFIYEKRYWAWFNKPYNSAYIKYKFSFEPSVEKNYFTSTVRF